MTATQSPAAQLRAAVEARKAAERARDEAFDAWLDTTSGENPKGDPTLQAAYYPAKVAAIDALMAEAVLRRQLTGHGAAMEG